MNSGRYAPGVPVPDTCCFPTCVSSNFADVILQSVTNCAHSAPPTVRACAPSEALKERSQLSFA